MQPPFIDKRAKVISVFPEDGEMGVALFTPAKVEFDKEVNLQEVKFSSEPTFSFEVSQPVDNKRKIEYRPTDQLQMETTYKITVDAGYPFSWEFHTRGDIAGASPEWESYFEQQEKEYEEKYAKEDAAINSLREDVPIVTENFQIDFSYETGEFIVTILKGDPSAQKSQVLEYFKNKGILNLERIKIKWQQ